MSEPGKFLHAWPVFDYGFSTFLFAVAVVLLATSHPQRALIPTSERTVTSANAAESSWTCSLSVREAITLACVPWSPPVSEPAKHIQICMSNVEQNSSFLTSTV